MACLESDPRCDWLSELVEELRRSHNVRYRDVAEALRNAIATGRIAVGTQLPPERELAGHLGTGRTTVVQAYNLLRADALLRSRQGAGTWVVRRPDA